MKPSKIKTEKKKKYPQPVARDEKTPRTIKMGKKRPRRKHKRNK